MPICPRCRADVTVTQRFCGSCAAPLPASSEAGTVAMDSGTAARQSRTSAPDDGRFAPGTVVAQRYRIAGPIGKGGMGEVFKAYDLILAQNVALKFLPYGLTRNELSLERFRNEVRLARQVSHPNVCRVYDIGEVEGAPFLTMEYVDGEDLASLLRRIGRLPADKALDISRRLCAGLAAAHEKGVLHRDLKPGNILIDGRGEVLIADFGLAAIAGTITGEAARQGSPTYMAPEQLMAGEVTERTDLYALGLVLYEMFTGRRAFEAATAADLVRQQRESTPASIISTAKDVDPAVERAVLRCLAPDPRHRPASARLVAAALPGGDPLAAAIAAGETPSPEMVAGAGDHEGLRPAIAIGLFAAIIVGLVGTAALSTRFSPIERIPFENSPDALASMARDHARRFGYAERPGATAFFPEWSNDYFTWAHSHKLPRVVERFAAARPAPVTFWYRQSPGVLDPGADQMFVTMDKPGFQVSGMLRIRVDSEGRLLSFEAMPREKDAPAGPSAPPDWTPLFQAAGLDPARFSSAGPEWVPLMAFDARAAWTGSSPEAADIPIRIEAAAWRGKAVSFRIIEPWTKAARDEASSSADAGSGFMPVLIFFILFPTACFLAWRNVRLGRGDVRSAARLAVGGFVLGCLSDLLMMSHIGGGGESIRLIYFIALDLTIGALIGVLYLALEPYVRRRYPKLLVSWTRMLAAGVRDSMVATHILVGVLAATGLALLTLAATAIQIRLEVLPTPSGFLVNIIGARHFVAALLGSLPSGLFLGVMILFLFFVLRVLLRRDWLAVGAALLIFSIGAFLSSTSPATGVPDAIAFWGTMMIVMLRAGLLAAVSAGAVMSLVPFGIPLTLDPSRWYFGYSVALLLTVAALAAWAFRVSLGGRKLLRDETLS